MSFFFLSFRLVIFIALLAVQFVPDCLFSQEARRTESNNRGDIIRTDEFGNLLGKGSVVFDVESIFATDVGGFSYLYRSSRVGESFNFVGDTGNLGIVYRATVGDALGFSKYHPYVLSRRDISGFSAEMSIRNIISFGGLYSRYNDTPDYYDAGNVNLREARIFLTPLLEILDLEGSRNVITDPEELKLDELVAGYFSFNLYNVVKSFVFSPIIPIDEITVSAAIMRTLDFSEDVINTLTGPIRESDDVNKRWRVKISSPYQAYTNLKYTADSESRIYAFGVRVKEKGESTYRRFDYLDISEDVDDKPVVRIERTAAGVDRGGYIAVTRDTPLQFIINLEDVAILGGIELEEADIVVTVDNGYVIQMVEEGEEFQPIKNDGSVYPEDVVAVHDRLVDDGSNRKTLFIPLGASSARQMYTFTVKGFLFDTVKYE